MGDVLDGRVAAGDVKGALLVKGGLQSSEI